MNETQATNPNPVPAQPVNPTVVPNPAPQNPPVPQVEVDAKNFKNKIKELKIKYDNLPKNSKLLITVGAVVFIIIFILLILVAAFAPKRGKTPVLTASPTPVAVTPAPEIILNASKYATDSGVLKIESDLNDFQKQLEGTDVRQSDLSVPNMDFNVNFNK